MFSRAKRFSSSELEAPASTSNCRRYESLHSSHEKKKTLKPKSSKSKVESTSNLVSVQTSLPEDLRKIMSQLKDIETRLQDRCDALESICKDLVQPSIVSFDDGFYSSRNSSPEMAEEEVDLFPVMEFSSNSDASVNIEELCKLVTEIICKKSEEKKSRSFWERTKFWLSCSKKIVRELVWPVIADGRM